MSSPPESNRSSEEETPSFDIDLFPTELFLKFRKQIQGIRLGLNLEFCNNQGINEFEAKMVLKPMTPDRKWKFTYEPVRGDLRVLSKKIPINKYLNLQVLAFGGGHMDKNEDSGIHGWSDVAKVVSAATSAASTLSLPPYITFSSNDERNANPLHKLQQQVTRVLKGFSSTSQVQREEDYNPEVFTSQKRQWARFHLQSSDQKLAKETPRIFESLVVAGLHPDSDIQALQKQLLNQNTDCMEKSRTASNHQEQVLDGVTLEPQVLFAYPPEKQLPGDLLSFCFPGGLEVHAVEKTSSMSELNEILLGQEHLKQKDLSFVFRLQVADDSTLYGCCMLVEEIVRKPSGFISMISEEKQPPPKTHHIITAPRCYCLLSKLPFFDLHFGVLKSIFIEERLQRLKENMAFLNFITKEGYFTEDLTDTTSDSIILNVDTADDIVAGNSKLSETNSDVSAGSVGVSNSNGCSRDMPIHHVDSSEEDYKITTFSQDSQRKHTNERGSGVEKTNGGVDTFTKTLENNFPKAVLPIPPHHQYESSESSNSLQGSSSTDRDFRSDIVETEFDEHSSPGQDRLIYHCTNLAWVEANNYGYLQIIREYYQLSCPPRGSTLIFHPSVLTHHLEYHRPGEKLLNIAGSTVDLRSCSTSLEFADAHNALLVEEEATSLSVWTVACVCGSLKLENVLKMFACALLEKQIVVICSNLGILSAAVLSIIPLIRPYQWQSLLMPVLPSGMLDFLDAPVPYIVGINSKTNEVQSKLMNAILIDANKNQVKSDSLPQLPRQKELFSSLSPYHATLVGESFLARKRPVYECTDTQAKAAKGFLAVLRSYLDSLCSNLRSHTITNVQSNDDKVSLLLKDSFVDSFPDPDQPFMKLFVDTQLFSVHTDLALSLYQKE